MKSIGPLNDATRYAGFWRRVGAHAIDIILFTPISIILMYLIYGPPFFDSFSTANSSFKIPGVWDAFFNYILPIVLTTFFWVRFLGTPGKLLLDCRVVDAQTGQALTIGRALLRYLCYTLSALPLMLGFLWIIWDKRKQGFHDKIAGSVVVIYDETTATYEELQTEFGKDIS